jgi:hypothetical protein
MDGLILKVGCSWEWKIVYKPSFPNPISKALHISSKSKQFLARLSKAFQMKMMIQYVKNMP